MFVTSENNRLPASEVPFVPEGSGVWGVILQLVPRDVLILRVSSRGSRGVPTIVMMDLKGSAPSLDQFADGDNVLRGAAVLSTRQAREVGQWTLEPLSEIRIGATEGGYDGDDLLVSVTQFTTEAGRRFSVPYAVATRPARGKRLWRAKVPGAAANP
ncbi:hypothetical protein LMG28614_00177 [Paraburkholderia ultramafica]|uniref:Uncharacterized protein n=1 Tax=Paraburkholderia ultramafica TaxID=1544867 RepID=A0A6S7BXK4_9BURK|nr:hypothetical protein [Paraburkholderia ultramafica]CAB3776253.1 hypothetical protein LMG28614_00177 [Paraburkholderia ultramafica]